MKRVALIEVIIDTDKHGSSSSSHTDSGTAINEKTKESFPADKFQVIVQTSDGQIGSDIPMAIRTNLAHELGHIVGFLAGTKTTMNDPRSKSQGNRWTEKPGDAVRAEEKQAWDIAREMGVIDEQEATRALETYNDPDVDSQLKVAIMLDSLLAYPPVEVN
jgi:hypothetical protein